MYLLDTDILSNLLRRSPSSPLLVRLAGIPAEQQFTSAVNFGELVYGARRIEAGGGSTRLLSRLEHLVSVHLPVLPFDSIAARRYGEIRAELERLGTPIGDADLRIAAIAMARGLTVVTGNVRHFRRVPGLAVENWLEEDPLPGSAL
jgi:tRNA(fMet)-specific endonuclease VapC